MRTLTPDIYKTQKSQIRDGELPHLFHSMLKKQAAVIFERQRMFDDALSAKADLFNLFFRQYNTILVLEQKVAHIDSPGARYIDITSVNVLIRSCHERFLAFWYLAEGRLFPDATPEEEAKFKWLCYYHGGLVDAERNNLLRARLVDVTAQAGAMAGNATRKRDVLKEIKNSQVFKQLEPKTQEAIERYGAWRIGNRKLLSWNGLARLSPIKGAIAEFEYHRMSLYAHTGFAGLEEDKRNNGSPDGLLAYLYVLAACLIFSLDSVLPDSDIHFTSRELACAQEFREIAQSWINLPPLEDLDE